MPFGYQHRGRPLKKNKTKLKKKTTMPHSAGEAPRPASFLSPITVE
uniref:Uncharacterized protein n=1 Tax=Anguilla anguilla TaxID=7936 RepID=A0A0E9WPJ9_ANGAN